MGKPWKHYTKWKKLVAEDHIFYDSINMKGPEKANAQIDAHWHKFPMVFYYQEAVAFKIIHILILWFYFLFKEKCLLKVF